MKRSFVVAGVVVVLLALVAVVVAMAPRRYEGFLSGMFVADQDFLTRASLGSMSLFIAPPSGTFRRARDGFLLVTTAEDEPAAAHAVKISYSAAMARGFSAIGGALNPGDDRYSIADVSIISDDAAPLLPATMSLSASIATGSLTLHSGGTVFAHLYRDNAASATALASYAAS